MTTKDNPMQKSEDVIEPRSEYGNLPPELKAMQTMMDAVFGAVIAAPKNAVSPMPLRHGGDDAGDQPRSHDLKATPVGGAAPDFAPRRMDIEEAIMRAPGFDYNLAWEIFAALQARLESRYENNLNPKVADLMKALDRALAAA